MNEGLRILHLEDDPGDARLVRDTLRSEGFDFEIITVDSAEAFKAALEGDSFDLILADQRLPAFGGREALAWARARRPGVPVIFVTGALDEDRVVDLVKSGASDLVLKDRLSRLGLAVRRALSGPAIREGQRVQAGDQASPRQVEHVAAPSNVDEVERPDSDKGGSSAEPRSSDGQTPPEDVKPIEQEGAPLRSSGRRTLVVLAGSLFLAEFTVMYFIGRMPEGPWWVHGFFDALLMLVLSFPLLYLLALRPLHEHIRERRRVEQELRHHRQHLEDLIAQRTSELVASNAQLRQTVSDQRRVEEALRESEERVRQALQVGRMFAFHWNAKTDRVVRSSPQGDILGIDGNAELGTGADYFRRIHAEDRLSFQDTVWQLRPAADRYRTTYRLNHPNGSIVTVEESGRGFFDAHGQLADVIGIAADVTAREKMEQALRWELAVNEAVSRLSTPLMAPETTTDHIADAVLVQALGLTESQDGFVSVLDPATKEQVCHAHTRGIRTLCRCWADHPSLVCPLGSDGKFEGVCGKALNSGTAFLTNDLPRDLPAAGEPGGIRKLLGVPVFLGNELVGQILVADSSREYVEQDVLAVARLAEQYALGIQSLRFKNALQSERDFVRAILATAPALVAVLDRDARIVRFNQACEVASGYRFEEVAGTVAWELLAVPEEAQFARDLAARLLRGEFPIHYESHWLGRDGTRRRIMWSMTVLKDNTGDIQNLIAAGVDVTETRAAEEKLRVLTQAMETGPASVVITDGDGSITYLNPAFAQLTGYSLEEVLRKTPRVWKSGIHSPEFYTGLWGALTRGQDWSGEICNRKKNGELFWVYTTISPIKDEAGRVTHFVSVLVDITERKRYEEALEHSREDLEKKVAERTADLENTVRSLREEIEARARVEGELQDLLRFERLVAEIATEFAQLKSPHFETIVQETGRRLLEFLQGDRVSLVEFVAEDIFVTVSWNADGTPPVSQQRIPAADLAWSRAQVRAGRTICYADLDELPDEAAVDRETYRRFGTRSLVVLPLAVEGETVGALAFAATGRVRKWPEQAVQRLRLIQDLFAGLLMRWRSEAALSEAEARYHAVADFMQGWEYWESPEGAILYCSPACARITGYEPQQFLVEPRLLHDIVIQEDAPLWLEFHKMAFERPRVRTCEFRIRRKDGEIRWIEHHSQPVLGELGQFLGLRASHRDHTAEKYAELESQRLREELARVSRITAADHLAASIAHELRQPLTAILSDTEAAQQFLSQDPPNLDEVREALEAVIENDERASGVIQRLRALCRQTDRARTAVDINQIIEETLPLVRSELIVRQVSWQQKLARPLPAVTANRVEIQQVLVNLVINARDAMADTGLKERRLTLTTAIEDSQFVRVSVSDTGRGICAEALSHIFEPFFTTKNSGMGMGLAISRSIIEAHGGRFWAANNPSSGATFNFTLPLWKEHLR